MNIKEEVKKILSSKLDYEENNMRAIELAILALASAIDEINEEKYEEDMGDDL